MLSMFSVYSKMEQKHCILGVFLMRGWQLVRRPRRASRVWVEHGRHGEARHDGSAAAQRTRRQIAPRPQSSLTFLCSEVTKFAKFASRMFFR